MDKILIISNCQQCHNCYWNYMPDGKNGKLWCSKSNKQINNVNEISEHCKLDDVNSIYQMEPDYNPSDNDHIDNNA